MSVKVNNVAKYAESKRYIVARSLDGELWFWGAWDDEEKAKQAAAEIDGVVVSTECLDEAA